VWRSFYVIFYFTFTSLLCHSFYIALSVLSVLYCVYDFIINKINIATSFKHSTRWSSGIRNTNIFSLLQTKRSPLNVARQFGVLYRMTTLFQKGFSTTFTWPKKENHDLLAQHISPHKRYTTYECTSELVVTVPAACTSTVRKIKL